MNYNTEAEQQILGAILCEPDALLRASEILQPSDFYHASHRVIYDALLDLYQLGINIDIISLSERLTTKGTMKQAGGLEAVSTIAAQAFTGANIRYHAKIVHEKSLIRRTGTWAAGITAQSQNGVDDINSWLGQIESGFTEIAQIAKPKSSPYARDIIPEVEKDWDAIRAGNSKFIPTPDFFGDELPCYCPGHLWVIGGYTSIGKSTLLSEMLCDASERGGRPLLFSTEDLKKEKLSRLIANLESIPYKHLLLGKVDNYREKIEKAKKYLNEWNPIIYDNIRTIDDIRLITKKHFLRDNINIVCLDYIQNLFGSGTFYETLVDAILKFNAMIKDLGVTGIVLSQIDNESAKKSSNVIGLKGAGELAATADIVLWLQRSKTKGKERYLSCAIKKNKPFGAVAELDLAFDATWSGVQGWL